MKSFNIFLICWIPISIYILYVFIFDTVQRLNDNIIYDTVYILSLNLFFIFFIWLWWNEKLSLIDKGLKHVKK